MLPDLTFSWRSDPPPSDTLFQSKCSCQMASRSVRGFQQGARIWQTDDRPRYTEKCA